MGIVKKTLWHTTVYAAGTLASRGLAVLLIPLYTRVLPKADVANWDLSMATLVFLTPVLDLGISTALLRYYHRYESEDERRVLFTTCLAFTILIQVVVLAAGLGFAERISVAVYGTGEYANLVCLVAVSGTATVLSRLPLSWFRAQERSGVYTALNIVRAGVGPAAILLFVLGLDMAVEGILWGELLGLMAMALVGFYLCKSWLGKRVDVLLLRPLLEFGVPLLPAGIAVAILTTSDRYFIREWVGTEQLAVYAIGAKAGMMIQFLTQALQTAYAPAAYRVAKEPDAPAVFARLLRLLTIALAGLAVGLSALGPELLHILAPADSYSEAIGIIPWIAVSYAIHSCVYSVMTGFSIVCRTAYATFVICCGGAIKLLLNYLLIRDYGLGGAAAATFFAFAFELGLAYAMTQRVYPVPHDWPRLSLLAIATLGSLGAISVANYLDGLLGFCLRMGLFSVFAAMVLAFVATGEERRHVKDLGQARIRGLVALWRR